MFKKIFSFVFEIIKAIIITIILGLIPYSTIKYYYQQTSLYLSHNANITMLLVSICTGVMTFFGSLAFYLLIKSFKLWDQRNYLKNQLDISIKTLQITEAKLAEAISQIPSTPLITPEIHKFNFAWGRSPEGELKPICKTPRCELLCSPYLSSANTTWFECPSNHHNFLDQDKWGNRPNAFDLYAKINATSPENKLTIPQEIQAFSHRWSKDQSGLIRPLCDTCNLPCVPKINRDKTTCFECENGHINWLTDEDVEKYRSAFIIQKYMESQYNKKSPTP